MDICSQIRYQLDLLIDMLDQLEDAHYIESNDVFSSIGAHTRHVIEYLQILEKCENAQGVDYSARDRNKTIEQNKGLAIEVLMHLKDCIQASDEPIIVHESGCTFHSSYNRELLYQHEHIVHHCAIMRIKLSQIPSLKIDPCFGFAKSTLEYQNANVST